MAASAGRLPRIKANLTDYSWSCCILNRPAPFRFEIPGRGCREGECGAGEKREERELLHSSLLRIVTSSRGRVFLAPSRLWIKLVRLRLLRLVLSLSLYPIGVEWGGAKKASTLSLFGGGGRGKKRVAVQYVHLGEKWPKCEREICSEANFLFENIDLLDHEITSTIYYSIILEHAWL